MGSTYLTFSSTEPFSIRIWNGKRNWNGTLYYSTDAFMNDECAWDGTTTINSSEHDGEHRLYMRGISNSYITGTYETYHRFVLDGNDIRCSGNIENLLDYEVVANGEHPSMNQYCYAYMFRGCTSLTEAPELPATTLASSCYFGMFSSCTSLTEAPELPATTLAHGCYNAMFTSCTSLTKAPELPATTLANNCYYEMFAGSGLTQAPELPATTLADHCYGFMFSYCAGIKLYKSPPAGNYKKYRIPTTGNITNSSLPTGALAAMFSDTGGEFKGTAAIGVTYYLAVQGDAYGTAHFIGINEVAERFYKIYIGNNQNKAITPLKGYIGDSNGVARRIYPLHDHVYVRSEEYEFDDTISSSEHYLTDTCSCGSVIKIFEPHDSDTTNIVSTPTCTEEGETTHSCSKCGRLMSVQKIPAEDHDLDNTAVRCDNKYVWTCRKCGYVGINDKPSTSGNTPPLVHVSVVTDPAVDPTCTTGGLTEGSHCEYCNTVIVPQEYIDMVEHTMDYLKPNGDGTYLWACAVCGYEEDREYGPTED